MIIPSFGLGHKIAAIVALCALTAIAGAWGGHRITKGYYEAREAARIKAEAAEMERLNRIAYDLGQALAAETRKRHEQARAHRAEIEKWRKHGSVQVQCPAGGGLARITPDSVRFDAGFVDLWNAGLRLGLPAAKPPGRPDGAAERADPPTATDLLANTADNAEACNGDRARLRALQAWVREATK